jgi:SAM-dependent methyltransferase
VSTRPATPPAPPVAKRIDACRACGGARLEPVLSLGDLPLSDGLLTADDLDRPEGRHPLEVVLCRDCALVQILHTVPPEALFGDDYPYYASYADSWLRHAEATVRARMAECRLGPGSLVVELASNDGYLLQYYRQAGVPVLGIDPAAGPVAAARSRGVPTRQAFFGRELARALVAEGVAADVVHANNVLAHVPDPRGFLEGVALILKADGLAVIEVPYVRDLIDGLAFDTIYHEHLSYFSVSALERLVRGAGLVPSRIERLAVHGGSLRLFVRHRPGGDGSVARLLAEERAAGIDRIDYFQGFGRRVAAVVERLRALLLGLRAEGAHIAAYGAAAKGTILLNAAGIGPEVVDYVVDRNPYKQGRWVPGVRLPILAPGQLLETRPDYVLILPWNLRDEIIAQQAAFREGGGRFVVPLPEPVIVP